MIQQDQSDGIKTPSIRPPFGWTFTPHALIFMSSACTMIVEVVAGRMIARHLGSSLYTWTSIIGVVLAGMSLGNYVGGRMADRWAAKDFLGWLFLGSAVTCLASLFINHGMATGTLLEGWYWPTRILLTVFIIFLLPALVLGTISPVAAKLALDRSQKVGTTIGAVYAWGAVGSILGTFASGFYLIATLGARGVILVVALCLSVIGLGLGPHRMAHLFWVVLITIALYFAQSDSKLMRKYATRLGLRDSSHALFAADSNYQFVKVVAKESARYPDRNLRVLSLDFLIHGYVDLEDPEHLEYDYELVYREVALRFARNKKTLRAFFIGGGSYTFPRWIQYRWPGSEVDVAEIDPLVVEANHRALGLKHNTTIRTFIRDARNAVDDLPPEARYDFFFGDAFNDLSVPYHLTTLEFNQKVAAHLKPDGAYLVNVIDTYSSGLLLGAYVETLKRTFKHVAVFCTEKSGVKEGRDTFVVAASNKPIDFSDLEPNHESELHGSLLIASERASLASKCGGRILTDDDAPVENLLAPVVRSRK